MRDWASATELSDAKQSNIGVLVLPLWSKTVKDVHRESESTIRWSEHNRFWAFFEMIKLYLSLKLRITVN